MKLHWLSLSLAVVWLAAPQAASSTTLYAISGDANGVPRNLTSFNVLSPGLQTSVNLGDGSYSYAGGLAYIDLPADTFLAIQTDNTGTAELVGAKASGVVTPVGLSLGMGGFGGAAVVEPAGPNTVFWYVYADSTGNSALLNHDFQTAMSTYSLNLGQGLGGGLAYDTNTGLFYLLWNDSTGASSLLSINTQTNSVSTLPINLGSGFTGGLVYSNGFLYGIGNDMFANSTLYQFLPTSGAPTAMGSLGQGFLYASLAVGPDGSSNGGNSVPEPSSLLLAGSAALLLFCKSRRK